MHVPGTQKNAIAVESPLAIRGLFGSALRSAGAELRCVAEPTGAELRCGVAMILVGGAGIDFAGGTGASETDGCEVADGFAEAIGHVRTAAARF